MNGSALPQQPVKAKSAANGDEVAGSEPPLLLAESRDNSLDLADWWMSEKLDGVRALGDGKQFLLRQGNLYHAPDWFIERRPNVPLDGELWIDRKAFQPTVSIVRQQDKNDQWQSVRYQVFDAPTQSGRFEERVEFLGSPPTVLLLVEGDLRSALPAGSGDPRRTDRQHGWRRTVSLNRQAPCAGGRFPKSVP